MLKINVPVSKDFMPYIMDVMKIVVLNVVIELLTTNALGAPLSSAFNAGLAQKLLFNALAFAVFHLLIAPNVQLVFADEK